MEQQKPIGSQAMADLCRFINLGKSDEHAAEMFAEYLADDKPLIVCTEEGGNTCLRLDSRMADYLRQRTQ